jgi:hypothetical protein
MTSTMAGKLDTKPHPKTKLHLGFEILGGVIKNLLTLLNGKAFIAYKNPSTIARFFSSRSKRITKNPELRV